MAPQLSAYVPWTAGLLNRLGVVAASASLSHQGYVEHTRAQIRAARDSLCVFGRFSCISHRIILTAIR